MSSGFSLLFALNEITEALQTSSLFAFVFLILALLEMLLALGDVSLNLDGNVSIHAGHCPHLKPYNDLPSCRRMHVR